MPMPTGAQEADELHMGKIDPIAGSRGTPTHPVAFISKFKTKRRANDTGCGSGVV